MTEKTPRNLAASVRARLQNLAKERQEDFGLLLTRFGLERLMYRLGHSRHHETFVLKGAMLFQLWSKQPHRATRDVDFLGYGEISVSRFEDIFRELCTEPVEGDGLVFLPETVRGEHIKEEDEYQGIRIRLEARLENAKIRFHVDIGFGDVIIPKATQMPYPTLLDFPKPLLLAYSREAVVAEKFHAIVTLGITNSRMKDFFDLWILARESEFDGELLCRAIKATFGRRKTVVPVAAPLAFSEQFTDDIVKNRQWLAFLKKGNLLLKPPSLVKVVSALREFLLPTLEAIHATREWKATWQPGGPWTPPLLK